MPLQSPPRKVSETENMLRLLLCVDALESVTPTQLWTFVAELDLMDYVSMRLCLHKLLAAGELETGEGSFAEQLLLTDRGREALSLFGARLPQEVRDAVTAAAPAFRGRVSRKRQVRAVYEMARPNDYRLNLSVCEGDLPTVFLRMATINRTLASKALRRFETCAAEMTTYLYGLAERAASGQTLTEGEPPPPDAIREHSANEVTARVMLIGKKARFAAELLLPSRKSAEAFIRALSPEAEGAAVANRLTEMLSGPSRTANR
ncbi:MAG TPA: DUF4364 family protein [Candidatus Limiplasma sp.]|nr:DUF4364 family protein [Candidatus Limiplasma sp.]HPS80646.1 DUF4364 family protein [Candidatus Limiplasma sp.]